jgi:hypothetical protein
MASFGQHAHQAIPATKIVEKDAGCMDCSDEYIATDRLYPDRSAGNGRKFDGLPTLVGRWSVLLRLQRL